MAEIQIIPRGIEETYSYACRKNIITYKVDIYYNNEGYSQRIGYAFREKNGQPRYGIDKDYEHLSDEIDIKLREILGPNGFWPSALRYPTLVTRASQTEATDSEPQDVEMTVQDSRRMRVDGV